jgi:HNH endonuclease
MAHRWAYSLLVGPISDGLEINHLCRNRACVNPDHLEPLTHADHAKVTRSRTKKTHCPSGHPYAGDNLYINPTSKAPTCRACWRVRYHAMKGST